MAEFLDSSRPRRRPGHRPPRHRQRQECGTSRSMHGTLTWTAVKGEPRVRVVDLMDPDTSAGNASWSMTAPRWAKSFSLRVTGQRGTTIGALLALMSCLASRSQQPLAVWAAKPSGTPVRNETRGDALMVGVGGRDDLPYGRWHVTAIDRFEGGIQRASRDFRPCGPRQGIPTGRHQPAAGSLRDATNYRPRRKPLPRPTPRRRPPHSGIGGCPQLSSHLLVACRVQWRL